jgi:hypothetical protein
VATTISGSSRSVLPSGAVSAERAADLHARDVEVDVFRHLERQRLDRDLAQRLREHAALAHAWRVVTAEKLDGHRSLDRPVEPHLLQVDVRDTAPHGIDLVLLEDRRVSLSLAVDLDVEDRVEAGRARQRAPQLALRNGDRHRLAAAVEDARNEALLAQAPRLSRAEPLALGNQEFCAFSGHSGRGV